MIKQKINLKRIKVDLSKQSQKIPDYDGFFSNSRGDFYVVGWLSDSTSDLDLIVEKVDELFLLNKFNSKKYFNWKYKR